MERLVIRIGNEPAVPTEFDMDFAFELDKGTFDGLQRIFNQLCDLTDILGTEYDIDRLRELAQADKEGQCFIGPFVAMIEQSLSGGEMKPQRDQRFNGRYAVVYFDPKKWSSPLIDICGTPYNREEAEERMKVLKAALRREQDDTD